MSARIQRLLSAAVFLLFFLMWPFAFAMNSTTHADQPDRPTRAAEARISEESMPGGGVAVKAVFFIDANPDAVYAILKDASRFPEFMPDTADARIIDSGEDYQVAAFVGGNGLMQARFVMKRVFADKERRISWTQIEGRAREVEGSWVIREEAGAL